MRALRKLVNQSRQHFFPCAAFTQQQHRNIHVGYQRRLGANLLHRRTAGHKEHVIAKLLNLARVWLRIRPQALLNDRIQLCLLKRLGQIILSAQTNGLHHLASVAHAGEHHHFHAGFQLLELFQCLQSINSRHQPVE